MREVIGPSPPKKKEIILQYQKNYRGEMFLALNENANKKECMTTLEPLNCWKRDRNSRLRSVGKVFFLNVVRKKQKNKKLISQIKIEEKEAKQIKHESLHKNLSSASFSPQNLFFNLCFLFVVQFFWYWFHPKKNISKKKELSFTEFDFGQCAVSDRKDVICTITNKVFFIHREKSFLQKI